jgi:antirestriction protein ArdC
VFWKFANDAGDSQEDGAESGCSRLLFTRGYSVFNAAQVYGYTPKVDADATMPERITHAEAFFQAIGVDLRHGGNEAFYAPASDHIQTPPFGAFADNVAYYSTPMSIRPDVIASWASVSAITPMLRKTDSRAGRRVHVRAPGTQHRTSRGPCAISRVMVAGA